MTWADVKRGVKGQRKDVYKIMLEYERKSKDISTRLETAKIALMMAFEIASLRKKMKV